MPLLTDTDLSAPPPRSRFLWTLLGVVAAGQLCAFWMVCTQQVRKAEARRAEAMVQQMALSDCLQYIPGSTIASCSTRLDANAKANAQAADAVQPTMTGAVPVSFNYR